MKTYFSSKKLNLFSMKKCPDIVRERRTAFFLHCVITYAGLSISQFSAYVTTPFRKNYINDHETSIPIQEKIVLQNNEKMV